MDDDDRGDGNDLPDDDDDDDDYHQFMSDDGFTFHVKKITEETHLELIRQCEAKGYKKICLEGELTDTDKNESYPIVLNADKDSSICEALKFVPADDEDDNCPVLLYLDKYAEGCALKDSIEFVDGYPMNEKAEFKIRSRKKVKSSGATTPSITESAIRTHREMSKHHAKMSISASHIRSDEDDETIDMSADDLDKQIQQVSFIFMLKT